MCELDWSTDELLKHPRPQQQDQGVPVMHQTQQQLQYSFWGLEEDLLDKERNISEERQEKFNDIKDRVKVVFGRLNKLKNSEWIEECPELENSFEDILAWFISFWETLENKYNLSSETVWILWQELYLGILTKVSGLGQQLQQVADKYDINIME